MEKRLKQLIKILLKESIFYLMTGKDQLALLVAFEKIDINLIEEFEKINQNKGE